MPHLETRVRRNGPRRFSAAVLYDASNSMQGSARLQLSLIFCLSVLPRGIDPVLRVPPLIRGHSDADCAGIATAALAPAPKLMSHAREMSAYWIRRWMAPWAWADDYSIRSHVWEFEPADAKNRARALRVSDLNPLSSSSDPIANPALKAQTLLENLRETPMRRGDVAPDKGSLRNKLANVIRLQDVPKRLAERIARQLLHKFNPRDLGDELTWQAMGAQLNQEIERLRTALGLTERQIITILPKLSADQMVDLIRKLQGLDAKVARTIANAAVDAADPVSAAIEFLKQYNTIVDQLQGLDSRVARTIANGAFKAHDPSERGLVYATRFQALLAKFRDDVSFARTVARIACKTANPLESAENFLTAYEMILREHTAIGVELSILQTIALIAASSADPLLVARHLLANFSTVLSQIAKSHPTIARSIALAACRSPNPAEAARLYLQNYDDVVRVISQTDPHLAHEVAGQTFRSDNPLPWAERYLAQLKASRKRTKRPTILVPFVVFVRLLYPALESRSDCSTIRLLSIAS